MTSNILDVLKDLGLTPKRMASTNGGEYASPCPACGGRDRFRIWPEKDRYWCRSCGQSGDAIQYLRDFRGLSFAEACRAVGREPVRSKGKRAVRRTPSWTPRVVTSPPSAWIEKAEVLIGWAESMLWAAEGTVVLSFLRGRGLSDQAIKTARLGYLPKTVYRTRESWGLPIELKTNGVPKKLWIPKGLVIPYILNDRIVRIRTRRMDGSDPRYVVLSGSQMGAMILGDAKSCLVLESELDALLTYQETGDMVTSIALGNAQSRPDKLTATRLKNADTILIALDSDVAGARESWRWWVPHYSQARRWPLPGSKDPGEAAKAGLILRLWIEEGLNNDHDSAKRPVLEPLPEPEPRLQPLWDGPEEVEV